MMDHLPALQRIYIWQYYLYALILPHIAISSRINFACYACPSLIGAWLWFVNSYRFYIIKAKVFDLYHAKASILLHLLHWLRHHLAWHNDITCYFSVFSSPSAASVPTCISSWSVWPFCIPHLFCCMQSNVSEGDLFHSISNFLLVSTFMGLTVVFLCATFDRVKLIVSLLLFIASFCTSMPPSMSCNTDTFLKMLPRLLHFQYP